MNVSAYLDRIGASGGREPSAGNLAALLRELGYEVREYAGRWLRNNQQNGVPRRCHRVVCVRVGDGPVKLADAGIGLPYLAEPLEVVLDRKRGRRMGRNCAMRRGRSNFRQWRSRPPRRASSPSA